MDQTPLMPLNGRVMKRFLPAALCLLFSCPLLPAVSSETAPLSLALIVTGSAAGDELVVHSGERSHPTGLFRASDGSLPSPRIIAFHGVNLFCLDGLRSFALFLINDDPSRPLLTPLCDGSSGPGGLAGIRGADLPGMDILSLDLDVDRASGLLCLTVEGSHEAEAEAPADGLPPGDISIQLYCDLEDGALACRRQTLIAIAAPDKVESCRAE